MAIATVGLVCPATVIVTGTGLSPRAIYLVTSSQALCIPIHEAMDSRDQSIELGLSTQVHEPRLASQVYEPRRALLEGQFPLAEGFIPIA